jgi:flagellar biosynthesis/type III secretory pathway protein FliH
MYDQREKALRDYEWGLSSARQEGLEEGLEKGLEKGRQEGLEKGKLTGSIQLLQQLLGEPVAEDRELLDRTPEELETQLALLQQRLRDRQA